MAVPKLILFFRGIFSIPHFTEIDITNFLINYEDMYENYNIKKRERIRPYSRYCIEYIIIIVRELSSFFELN
jgi:hypothetical protein